MAVVVVCRITKEASKQQNDVEGSFSSCFRIPPEVTSVLHGKILENRCGRKPKCAPPRWWSGNMQTLATKSRRIVQHGKSAVKKNEGPNNAFAVVRLNVVEIYRTKRLQ